MQRTGQVFDIKVLQSTENYDCFEEADGTLVLDFHTEETILSNEDFLIENDTETPKQSTHYGEIGIDIREWV
jgi:hypothetical protein